MYGHMLVFKRSDDLVLRPNSTAGISRLRLPALGACGRSTISTIPLCLKCGSFPLMDTAATCHFEAKTATANVRRHGAKVMEFGRRRLDLECSQMSGQSTGKNGNSLVCSLTTFTRGIPASQLTYLPVIAEAEERVIVMKEAMRSANLPDLATRP
jgi:hypothetical protein